MRSIRKKDISKNVLKMCVLRIFEPSDKEYLVSSHIYDYFRTITIYAVDLNIPYLIPLLINKKPLFLFQKFEEAILQVLHRRGCSQRKYTKIDQT